MQAARARRQPFHSLALRRRTGQNSTGVPLRWACVGQTPRIRFAPLADDAVEW